MKKRVSGVHPAPKGHWVGDGFPVRSLISYEGLARELSPFLLLDYAGPTQFMPAQRPRGVGEHPHRGFETVTIVYQGEVAHRDSVGNCGVIGPGDVQWMTAAAGILHEEFHSPAFTHSGGVLEMAQLWVNLPAKYKMSAPGYQTVPSSAIPQVLLPEGAGRVRVIAGTHAGGKGPAGTFSEMNVWDVRLSEGCSSSFFVPEGHTAAIAVLRGAVTANGSRRAGSAELITFERAGEHIHIAAEGASTLLFLSGQPLDEPIVGYGPFVMNSREEIETAISDFQGGKFGVMTPTAPADERHIDT